MRKLINGSCYFPNLPTATIKFTLLQSISRRPFMIWPPFCATFSSFYFWSKKSLSVSWHFCFKPLLLEDDGTWCRIGMMYIACDVLCSRCQDVPAVAVTVLECGGGWNKGFVTSVPSHTVHKEAAGMPCELFWSQECRQCWRLFRALWWPVPLAGFLRGLFCSLYKMPKAFNQPPVLSAGTVEVCLPQLIQRILFWSHIIWSWTSLWTWRAGLHFAHLA